MNTAKIIPAATMAILQVTKVRQIPTTGDLFSPPTEEDDAEDQ